jgi:succinylarginine dihydrolase
MCMLEVNFDGLVGPSHNYAGLSLGNIASATHAGSTSAPREAALQGLAKMRHMMALGLPQGLLLPHDRPDAAWLRRMGFAGSDLEVCRAAWAADPALFRNSFSASAMWTANAATVSPRPDSADGLTHLSVANLFHAASQHRGSADAAPAWRPVRQYARRQGPCPLPAPSAMRAPPTICASAPAMARRGWKSSSMARAPWAVSARQHRLAAEALVRKHHLHTRNALLARQSDEAIAAGAFHNDVVAVANETVLFTHEQAFAERDALYAAIHQRLPEAQIIEVPAARVSLADAIRSYLFNSQLVTLPEGGMLLLLPGEAREVPSVTAWLDELIASNGPIRQTQFMTLRESMRNGGGPACLRLRVALEESDIATLDQRFLLTEAKADALADLITRHWPERIAPDDIGNPDLWQQCWSARAALLDLLGFKAGDL